MILCKTMCTWINNNRISLIFVNYLFYGFNRYREDMKYCRNELKMGTIVYVCCGRLLYALLYNLIHEMSNKLCRYNENSTIFFCFILSILRHRIILDNIYRKKWMQLAHKQTDRDRSNYWPEHLGFIWQAFCLPKLFVE